MAPNFVYVLFGYGTGNMAISILKIGPYLGNHCSWSKINSIWTPWGRKMVHVKLPTFFSNSMFHIQIFKFWKSACISKTAARRAKMSLILTHCGRKSIYATLGPFFKYQISCPNIMEIWKLVRISKPATRRAKWSLISASCGRKRLHMQVWDVSSNSRFHAQMWKFKNSASISETAARTHMIEQKWAQFQPPEVERVCATSQTTSVLPSLFVPKIGMQILHLPANSVF